MKSSCSPRAGALGGGRGQAAAHLQEHPARCPLCRWGWRWPPPRPRAPRGLEAARARAGHVEPQVKTGSGSERRLAVVGGLRGRFQAAGEEGQCVLTFGVRTSTAGVLRTMSLRTPCLSPTLQTARPRVQVRRPAAAVWPERKAREHRRHAARPPPSVTCTPEDRPQGLMVPGCCSEAQEEKGSVKT